MQVFEYYAVLTAPPGNGNEIVKLGPVSYQKNLRDRTHKSLFKFWQLAFTGVDFSHVLEYLKNVSLGSGFFPIAEMGGWGYFTFLPLFIFILCFLFGFH
jgi:hypothetical protein